jgi:hypothetical protein
VVFECKRYTSGVPVNEISTKFDWADAERPKHLVILTTSYLTNNTRVWIDRIAPNKLYATHVIEGKELKSLILSFPSIVERYFIDKYLRLLTEMKRNWIIMDLCPDFNSLCTIVDNVNPEKLSPEYAALLWCFIRHDEEYRKAIEGEDIVTINDTPISVDDIFDKLVDYSEERDSVFEELNKKEKGRTGLWFYQFPLYDKNGVNKQTIDHVIISFFFNPDDSKSKKTGFYCFELLQDNAAIEILVENSFDLETNVNIRYIPDNAHQYLQEVVEEFTPPS